MSSTDTCVLRPELMEFEKYIGEADSLFLSLVARPDNGADKAGFMFTKRTVTSTNEADVTTLSYTPEDLADIHARQLFVSNIETDTVSKVTSLVMAEAGAGTIDMSQGSITQVSSMQFYESGATAMLNVTNDSIVFGESAGVLDMTQGNIVNIQNITMAPFSVSDFADGNVVNLQTMTLTQDTGTIDLNGGTLLMGGGNIDMANGAIINVTDLLVGDIRLHNTNEINNDMGNSLVLEGVDFKDQDITLIKKATFVDQTSVLDMADGSMIHIANLNMKTDGSGILDTKHGDVKHVENMTFGANEASLTLVIKDAGGDGDAPMIQNPSGGSVDIEKILFSQQTMGNISAATFTVGGASTLNMSDGTINDVDVLNMKADGSGIFDMKDGDVKHVENMTFGATDASLTLKIQDAGGDGDAPMIHNPSGGSVDIEQILFSQHTMDKISTATFTIGGASTLNMSEGTINDVNVLNMKVDGSGVIDMQDGDVRNVENLKLGTTLVINKDNSTNEVSAPTIQNPTGGSVDLEGILFNNKDMSLVTNLSFNAAGTIDLNNGTFSNLATLNMTAAGTLNMNQSDMLDLKNLAMTDTLTVGTVDLLGPTATIQHNNGGYITLEGVRVQEKSMTELTNLTFTTGGTMSLSDGVVSDVLTQTMTTGGTLNMSTGTIDFGAAGTLEMVGTAQINIGAMNMASNVLKNATVGGTVKVEDTEFNDSTVKTAQISKYDGALKVSVENTEFNGDDLTVTNVFTDTIQAKTASGAVTLKGTTLDLSSASTTNAIRITNVATPINDFDAANKKYVNEAVQENVQGLKPRKATDYSLSGGMEGGAPSDFDKSVDNAFGTFTSYAIEFVKNDPDADGNDMCELKFHLEDTVGDKQIMFDGVALNATELATIAASGTEATGPAIPKKRVLIMHLDETSINASASYYTGAEFTDKLAHDATDFKGLNGIWEIESFVDSAGVANWKTLTMKRAFDMNESAEVLNGAYTYVKSGSTRANYGFVVTSSDPIKLGVLAGPPDDVRGLTIEGITGDIMQLEWIEFNNIDFELAFVNEQGTTKELLANTNATFKKGGLAMKFDATDEKQIMVNAELLRYETGYGADGLSNGESLSLQINGNVDFNLANVDSYINSFGDETKVIINNTVFERRGTNANIYTTNITANTITAESDRTLKRNIVSMEDGIGLVSKLRSVNYYWKDTNKSQLMEYGFIAQEVEENFPSLVQTNPNTGIKSVDYPKVVSILTLALQELTAKVDALMLTK